MTRQGRPPLIAFAAVLALAAACGGPVRERLFVEWTFAGKTCDVAGVARVRVGIAGQIRTPDTFQCVQPDGISVYPLPPGLHPFSFLATAASGASYRLQNFPVTAVSGQNVLVTPDLGSVACASGACAGVLWSFSGLPCTDALVDTVRVYVDNQNAGEPACANGGGTVSNLTEGSHTLHIVGFR